MGLCVNAIKQAEKLFSKTQKYVAGYNKANGTNFTSILQTKPQSIKGIDLTELKFVPKLKTDTITYIKKFQAIEPYKSLLVRESDKAVQSKYFKNYLSEKEITYFAGYIKCYGNNFGLREGRVSKFDLVCDGAFSKAPALSDNATVYRGIERLGLKSSQEYIDSLKAGMITNEPAFLSTSKSLTDLKNTCFIDNAFKSNGAIMRIQLPKGTKGILLDDNEYLLPRNSKIKINSMKIIDGTKILDCEYIL